MFNVLIDYLPFEDELQVVLDTTSKRPEPIEALFSGEDILKFHEMVKTDADRQRGGWICGEVSQRQPTWAGGAPDFINQWVSWGLD